MTFPREKNNRNLYLGRKLLQKFVVVVNACFPSSSQPLQPERTGWTNKERKEWWHLCPPTGDACSSDHLPITHLFIPDITDFTPPFFFSFICPQHQLKKQKSHSKITINLSAMAKRLPWLEKWNTTCPWFLGSLFQNKRPYKPKTKAEKEICRSVCCVSFLFSHFLSSKRLDWWLSSTAPAWHCWNSVEFTPCQLIPMINPCSLILVISPITPCHSSLLILDLSPTLFQSSKFPTVPAEETEKSLKDHQN